MRAALRPLPIVALTAALLGPGCIEDPEGEQGTASYGSVADELLSGTTTLYVDPGAALGGDGSAKAPFGRLTDALDAARAIRAAAGQRAWASRSIAIEVGPGDLVGSYSAEDLAADPFLEPLPFLINMPRTVVRGHREAIVLDADRRPTGEVAGTPTRVIPDAPLGPADAQAVFLITDTTDGFAGNRSAVEGFVIESGRLDTDAQRGGAGVLIFRASGFRVTRNIFGPKLHTAVDSHHGSGEISSNYARDTAICSLCAEGPGTVSFLRNRALQSLGGILVVSTVGDFALDLGAHAQTFAVAPLVPPARAFLTAYVVGNDVSGHVRNANISFGIRAMQYGPNTAGTIEDQSIRLFARDNRIRDNAVGVWLDAGFPERNDLAPTGGLAARFRDNDVGGNLGAGLGVSFNRNTAALNCGQLAQRPYLQDTWMWLTLEGGDATRFGQPWIDHPAVDSYDGRWLNNLLFLNGSIIAPPYRYIPPAPDPC